MSDKNDKKREYRVGVRHFCVSDVPFLARKGWRSSKSWSSATLALCEGTDFSLRMSSVIRRLVASGAQAPDHGNRTRIGRVTEGGLSTLHQSLNEYSYQLLAHISHQYRSAASPCRWMITNSVRHGVWE